MKKPEMDPRLAARRHKVAEDRARSNLGRLVRFLGLLALMAVVVWFLQSPFLSVSRVLVTGAHRVDVEGILAEHGIVEGRAMVTLRLDPARQALAADPWIASVELARQWPTTVRVEITEREPAASVRLSSGWWLVAADATVLEKTDQADPTLPRARFPTVSESAAADDLEVAGAVEYLADLPINHRAGAVVRPGEGGLVATVDGFEVRLGGPFEMDSKAAVTAALLDSGLEQGSVLTVVAPASPAVLPPGASATTTVPAGQGGDG
jgi:cell division protein FtsQ